MENDRELMRNFWRYVEQQPNGCWRWIGGTTNQLYGRFWDGRRKVLAHRYAFETLVGDIPDGMLICHKCDNPNCVNPDHMFIGTMQDNMDDAKQKGRLNGRPRVIRPDCESIRKGRTRKYKPVHTPQKRGRKSLVPLEVIEQIVSKFDGTWGQKTSLANEFGITPQRVQYILRKQFGDKARVNGTKSGRDD